ncbi:LON peptidase substrate-binding domain-containing protein [Parvibium lacunae]|uniref:Lon N-terminal domain-containing protein n=1 Tax=Parvibium lacunae TaxID=1888893 RepID=A0A368L4Z4_9BURK|nr:LON peptidase substrate-binding domain-containing protein [Parvibium lacunae]RCS58659.1 hypothetical protein DU000_07630 [Parvibium lacunae]
MTSTTLPLLPLNAVLFPGGRLRVRILDRHYLDKLLARISTTPTFGVCLLKRVSANQADSPLPALESIGCQAQFVNEVGLAEEASGSTLQLQLLGGQRFQLDALQQSATGVYEAAVRWLGADPVMTLPARYLPCANLLKRIVLDLEKQPGQAPLQSPYQFDDASWVSNRLCELLTLPNPARQKLMELNDPLVRLSLLDQYLHQHQILSS